MVYFSNRIVISNLLFHSDRYQITDNNTNTYEKDWIILFLEYIFCKVAKTQYFWAGWKY